MERRARRKARDRMFAPMRRMSEQEIVDVLPWFTEQARILVENGEKMQRSFDAWEHRYEYAPVWPEPITPTTPSD